MQGGRPGAQPPASLQPVAHGFTVGSGLGRIEDDPIHIRLRSALPSAMAGDGDLSAVREPEISLTVMPFNTWQVVKRRIKEKWPVLKAIPDIHIRLLYKSVELRAGKLVDNYVMDGGFEAKFPIDLQYLIIDQGHARGPKSQKDMGLCVDSQVPCPPRLRSLVADCLLALRRGIQPRLTDEGTGATYMLRDPANKSNLAVFKPKDEEAYAPQNPRGYVQPENSVGLREGILSTQQAAREVAAYLLDHDKFAGVPETTLAHAKHPKFVKARIGGEEAVVWKIGAFQAFVEAKDTAGNFAPQVFEVSDVHRIGILDIRVVNLDRNDGNVLVARHRRRMPSWPTGELVPIDHGLSLPDRLEVYTYDIGWMAWPQARRPFGDEEREYVRKLDGRRDARLLAKYLGIRRECLRLMEVTTRLLQIGVECGLTLYDIGTLLYRVDRGDDTATQQKSALEKIIEACLDIALTIAGGGMRAGGACASTTLDSLDLRTSRPPGGPGALARQASPGQDSRSPLTQIASTPPLGPASPAESPERRTPPREACPPYQLPDPLSEPDLPGGEQPPAAPRSATGGTARRGPTGQSASQRSVRHSYRTGTSGRRTGIGSSRLHEGGSGDAEGSIFWRQNFEESDWTADLENIFIQKIDEKIRDHIKKSFPLDAVPEEPESASAEDSSPAHATSVVAAAFPQRPDPSPKSRDKEREKDRRSNMAHSTKSATAKKSGGGGSFAWGKALDDEYNYEPVGLQGVSKVSAGPPAPATDTAASQQPAVPNRQSSAHFPSLGACKAQPDASPPKPRWVPSWQRRAAAGEQSPAAPPLAAAGQEGGSASSSAPPGASRAAGAGGSTSALPTDAAGAGGRAGWCVNQGPRGNMEDAVDVISQLDVAEPTEFYAVYDGHGGTEAVTFVKRRLPQAVCRGRDALGDARQIGEALREAFTSTDEECLQHLSSPARMPSRISDSSKDQAPAEEETSYTLSSGCVCCVALLRGSAVHVANLGDCRALLCNGGEIVCLTADHRPEVNEGERARLEGLGVEVSGDGYLHGRIGVSRAFGDWAWERGEKCRGIICCPEIFEAEVALDTEFLLLACDGIFEKMSTREAGQIVRRRLRATGGDAKAGAEALVKNALARNGSDNLSAVVVVFRAPVAAETGRTAPRLFGRAAAASAPAPAPPAVAEAADAAPAAAAAEQPA